MAHGPEIPYPLPVRKGHAVTDTPAWRNRLHTVWLRNEEHDASDIAIRTRLDPLDIRAVFSGEAHPDRDTLAAIVFAITDKPGERESVLGAYDAAVQAHAPIAPTVLDTRTDTQILADAICDLADAVNRLADRVGHHQD